MPLLFCDNPLCPCIPINARTSNDPNDWISRRPSYIVLVLVLMTFLLGILFGIVCMWGVLPEPPPFDMFHHWISLAITVTSCAIVGLLGACVSYDHLKYANYPIGVSLVFIAIMVIVGLFITSQVLLVMLVALSAAWTLISLTSFAHAINELFTDSVTNTTDMYCVRVLERSINVVLLYIGVYGLVVNGPKLSAILHI